MEYSIRAIPVGTKFNRLTVTSNFFLKKRIVKGKERNEVFYKVKCDCGKEIESYGGNILAGRTKSCGCGHIGAKHPSRAEKKIGKRYGKLVVLEIAGEDARGCKFYLCQCDCGERTTVHTGNLRRAKSTTFSCGCNNRVNEERFLIQIRKTYSSYADGKKSDRPYRKNKAFELNLNDIKELVFANCNYCGSKPSNYRTYSRDKTKFHIKFNGIDRVDNNVGYIRKNCVPCCKICNYAKNTMTLKEFYSWLNKAYKYSNKSIKECLKQH
jgi:5-methylcytosine-specific restriction endonuclease McrA